jgi:adenylate cyclase
MKVPRQEIRRSHRIEVKLPFRYRRIAQKIVLPEVHSGTIRDIGYHGMLLEVDEELPLYSEIKLDFDLPLVDYLAANVYAKVVGLKKGKDGRIRAGVEFTVVPPETNTKIQLFVQLLIFTNLS